MLNEIVEYQQYVNPGERLKVGGKKEHRLNRLTRYIPRALTVIARHELMVNEYWNTSDREKKKIIREDVMNTLYDWCFKDTAEGMNATLAKLTGDRELYEKLRGQKSKKGSWASTDIYSPLCYKDPNIYSCNLARIVYSAVSEGPLKTRCLSCNRKFFEDLYDELDSEDAVLNALTDHKPLKRKRDEKEHAIISRTGKNAGNLNLNAAGNFRRLLQFLAAYLIGSEQAGDPSVPVYINLVVLAKWMDVDKATRTVYLYKNSPVFVKDDSGKWKMNDDFRKDYDIRLEEYDPSKMKRLSVADNDRCYAYELPDGLLFPQYKEIWPDRI